MKPIAASLLLAIAALGQTRSRPADYALVLEDPPLAQKVQSRAALQSQAAQAHRSIIRAAQASVLSELSRRKIPVTSTAEVLVNCVFVRATPEKAAELAAIPGVKRVQYLAPVKPALTTAGSLINLSAAWAAVGGGSNAGAGIKIGIIDSGIDQTHPGFQDAGFQAPSGFPKCTVGHPEDCSFTSNKVIVARSYVSLLVDSDPTYSTPDDTSPRDRVGHGTAIAMIAAGVAHSAPLGTIAGVAPKAFLGNYKIFGSPGVNDYTLFPAIQAALTDAVNDGMDIVTLALNEGDTAQFGPLDKGNSICDDPTNTGCDVRAQAVENASALGVLVVAAAGNGAVYGSANPLLNSINTPGTAPSAVTVGASQNGHLLYQSVKVNGSSVPSNLQRMNALFGDVKVSSPLTAPLIDVAAAGNDGLACTSIAGGSLSGHIALVQRGQCLFTDKINNAQAAGAVAVIIYQSDGSEDVYSSLFVQNTGIPAMLIGNTDGKALKSYIGSNPNTSVTLDPALTPVNNRNVNTLAPYSGRGPSIGNFAATRDFALKPELVAPGSDIYTAAQKYDPNGISYSADGYTTATGTSYAVGFVAGAAAMAKSKNSNLNTPGRLKSSVVNTASSDLQGGVHVTDVGAGKLNVADAVAAAATLEPAAISFGPIGAGSLPITRNLTITNVGSATATFSLAVRQLTGDNNARVTPSSSTVQLSAGQSQTISVAIQGSRPAAGAYEGFIDVTGAGPALHLPYYYVVGDGIPYNIYCILSCSFTGVPNDTAWLLAFGVVDQYGVPVIQTPVSFAVRQGGGKFDSLGGDSRTDNLGHAGVFVDLGPSQSDQVFTGTLGSLQQEFDGFARRLPAIQSGGVVNAATFQAGQGLAPGSYISIFGSDLSDASAAASTTYLPVSLAGIAVSFDGGGLSLPGHLHFVSPGQINVQIPWEFQGQSSVRMKVTYEDFLNSAVYTVPLASASPGSFGILDQNYAAVSSTNAAKRGQVIQIFANGLGPVNGHPASGDPAPATQILPCNANPAVTIGGVPATVAFCGLAPGFVGLYQLNVTVPSNTSTGTQPLVISTGGNSATINLPVE
jgi:uncharacterized protein (TIGR03437 family)